MIYRWVLPLLIAAELAGAGVLIASRLSRPMPPLPDLSRLDEATATDLRALHTRAAGSWEAWQELGEAYMAFGYFCEAEACFRNIADRDPDSFAIRYGWAYTLQRLGRLDEAVVHFRRAAEVAPPDMVAACRYHLGRCHLRREDVTTAEQAFRKASGFPPADFQMAKILVRSGSPEQALPILESLTRQEPDDLQPLQLMARVKQTLKLPAAAAELSHRSERATGKIQLTDHHQFLGPIRFRYGASREVLENARLRQRGRPDQAAANYHAMMPRLHVWDRCKIGPMLAELELQLGRAETAERLLLELFEYSNMTLQTLMLLGDAQAIQGRADEALETYTRALRIRSTADLHRRVAMHWNNAGDSERAKFHAASADCCDGVDAFRENELDLARQALEKSLQVAPQNHVAWFYLGEVRRAAGLHDRARDAYRRCLELNPAHGRAHSRIAIDPRTD